MAKSLCNKPMIKNIHLGLFISYLEGGNGGPNLQPCLPPPCDFWSHLSKQNKKLNHSKPSTDVHDLSVLTCWKNKLKKHLQILSLSHVTDEVFSLSTQYTFSNRVKSNYTCALAHWNLEQAYMLCPFLFYFINSVEKQVPPEMPS